MRYLIFLFFLISTLYGATLSFKTGWNFVGFNNTLKLSQDSHFSNPQSVKIIWKYVNDKNIKAWHIYSADESIKEQALNFSLETSDELEYFEGAWVYALKPFDKNIEAKNHNHTLQDRNLSSGWNLISLVDNETATTPESLNFENMTYVWVYRDGRWRVYNKAHIPEPTFSYDLLKQILPLEAFWVNIAESKPFFIEPFENITQTKYYTPFVITPNISYDSAETPHYFLENNNTSLLHASVNQDGVIEISSVSNKTGVSEINLIVFTNSQATNFTFKITVIEPSSVDFPMLDFTLIGEEDWDNTAVRKTLLTFAYGGHASDSQIELWSNMSPKDAIVEMLTLNATNPLLSPPDGNIPATTSLEELAAFWSNPDDNSTMVENYKIRFSTDTWSSTKDTWAQAVQTRGLNPFLHRVGLWETNYHMSVNQNAGIYPLPLFHHYDNIISKLSENGSYDEVLAQGAKNAAVAYQYGHNRNVFKNGAFRGNEDFAREFHQLFLGILGEYDHDYHENTAIPNTARALTDMRANWHPSEEGGPDSEIVFGEEFHYIADVDILKSTVSGANASEKIDKIASMGMEHSESLINLPLMIIKHFADDNLSQENSLRVQNSWKMMQSKNILPFLWAYAVSTDFHSPSRFKYASSIERLLRVKNLLTIDNEENYYQLNYAGWELDDESSEVFRPVHDVFGHQSGLEASDNANVFSEAYNRSAKSPWGYTRTYHCIEDANGDCPKDEDGTTIAVLEKNWKDKIPSNSNGEYVVEDVARWLWNYFIADGGKNYSALERAHLITLLNRKDLALFLDSEKPLEVYSYLQITTDTTIKQLLNDGSVVRMDLGSSDLSKRREADYRVGLAIAFIVATPYNFVQEGK